MLRRIFLALVFLLALTTGALAQTSGPITLRVGGAGAFKLPDKNATDPRSRADRAIVEAFERAHPDIRLASAQGLQIAGPAAESSLLLAFAGGTAPDVVYVNFRQSSSYIGQGFLLPLDDYLARDPEVMARLKPEVRAVLRDIGEGHVYSVPYAQFVQALYYRKDLFQAAGLDPDRPPTTWDEFYEDARRLTDQPKGVWGFEFSNNPGDAAYFWINFLWQAGGEVVRRNAAGQWEAAFDSPAGVSALLFYKKLLQGEWKGKDGKTYKGVASKSTTMPQDRATGKVGMWFQYQSNIIANTADASVLNPSLIGIAPMPRGPTGITANEVNAAMWGMSSQIKSARVKAAAWQFIKFMGSDEADRIRTKAYVEAGLGQTVNPLSLQKYGYDDYTSRNSRAWLQANKTLFANGKPEPYGENMSQIYVLLGNPLSKIESSPASAAQAILSESAREINAKLTNYVAPKQMRQRRRGAWTIFTLLLLALLGTLTWAARRALTERARTRAAVVYSSSPPGLSRRAQTLAWLFMLPALVSVLLWAYYPLVRGLVMAFQDYRILDGARSPFVGLDNFIDAFHQESFWKGLTNSLLYTAYSLAAGFFLPILLALGLSEIPRGKLFFRTLFYLPAVLAPLIITLLWKRFEDSTAQGLFNQILAFASFGHAGPIKWLEDPKWALFAVVMPVVWASAGPGSIIYLAALKSIPDEMYEAADLDGASVWTKIWRVTLPTLKPLVLINLVGATVGSFQAAQNILVQTGGGPAYATHTLGLEIWYNAFLYLKFGYATAAAWIMGALLIGFTLFQLRLMKDLKFAAARA